MQPAARTSLRDTLLKNDLTTLLLRLSVLYALWMACRVLFYVFNAALIGPILPAEAPRLLRGALLFDSISILYVNIAFVAVSLLPVPGRGNPLFQAVMRRIFVVTNAAALMINLADVFYYPYKLARITSDEALFLQEANRGVLLLRFFRDYWYGWLAFALCAAFLYIAYRRIRYRPFTIRDPRVSYPVQSLVFIVVIAATIVVIRGGTVTRSTIPITISDAGLFTRKPPQTALILSNPFCVIRSRSKRNLACPRYFPADDADSLFTPQHTPAAQYPARLPAGTNVVILLLESFGTAHIKGLSDQFAPGQESYTPFFDSLMAEGFCFTNAYKNATRSMDALPAIWASIPSFKNQFMRMSQSIATYKALPGCLADMGYTSAFLHGVVRESMGLVAFGQLAGIDRFFTRESYEKERGTDDYDGHWGIWDDRFAPFVVEKLSELPRPFFATYFTLSSHHPFLVPQRLADRFKEGTLPIHRTIRYADYSLRLFFQEAEKTSWYENTLFILVADHGQGADSRKYRTMPYSYAIPLLFFHPGGALKGRSGRIAQQIDIMPTVLDLVGYDKPSFGFGNSLFDPAPGRRPFALTYYGGTFSFLTDSVMHQFDEKQFTAAYAYRTDVFQQENIAGALPDEEAAMQERFMAALQQYCGRVRKRDYLPH